MHFYFSASSINLIAEWELKSSLDQLLIYPRTASLNQQSTTVQQPRVNRTCSFSGTTDLLSVSLFLQDTCRGANQKLSCKQLPYVGFHTSCSVTLLEN